MNMESWAFVSLSRPGCLTQPPLPPARPPAWHDLLHAWPAVAHARACSATTRIKGAYLWVTGPGVWIRPPAFMRLSFVRKNIISAFVRETDEQLADMVQQVLLPALFSAAYLDGRPEGAAATRREASTGARPPPPPACAMHTYDVKPVPPLSMKGVWDGKGHVG